MRIVKPSDTDVETTLMVTPPDTNRHGTAFGGWLMAQMDLIAAICATKFLNNPNCVTVCVDDLQFNKPIGMGDIVTLKARVNWTGNSSLEVGVKVFRQSTNGTPDYLNLPEHCLSGYLTFVQVHNGASRPLKLSTVVKPYTEEEEHRWKDAEQRRADRLSRKQK